LLKGLEISVLNLSEVRNSIEDFRIHSEFFKKEFLKNEIKLKSFNSKPLSTYSKISDGDHSKFPDNQKREVRYLQARDINDNFLEITSDVFVSKTYLDKNKRSLLKGEDILLSIMGTVGDITILPKGFKPAMCNRALAIIKNIKGISPQFLFSYLTTKFAFIEIERLKNGGVQQRLNLDVLSKLRIPNLGIEFQKMIEVIVLKAQDTRLLSKQSYTKAKNLLLEEIGLQNFTPSKEPVNIKSFKDSFGTSGRLDAEYYQPKYEKIEQAIKSYSNGFETLDAFIDDYSTGYPYKSSSYIKENGIPLIRINNIKKGHLDLSKAIQIPKEDLDLSTKDIAYENDILISMSGTIGNSCKIPKGIKAVVNQRIMKITPKNFNNEVLPLLINSVIGEFQLNRIGTGGVQTNISSTDIRKIFIPKIIENKQQQIANLIEQSFTLKKQSKHLLEVAKRAVEIAIEENEEVAIEWIINNE